MSKPCCSVCGRVAAFRCTGCKRDRYCSQDCQRQHWAAHKSDCLLLRQQAASSQVPVASTDTPTTPTQQPATAQYITTTVPPAPSPSSSLAGTISVSANEHLNAGAHSTGPIPSSAPPSLTEVTPLAPRSPLTTFTQSHRPVPPTLAPPGPRPPPGPRRLVTLNRQLSTTSQPYDAAPQPQPQPQPPSSQAQPQTQLHNLAQPSNNPLITNTTTNTNNNNNTSITQDGPQIPAIINLGIGTGQSPNPCTSATLPSTAQVLQPRPPPGPRPHPPPHPPPASTTHSPDPGQSTHPNNSTTPPQRPLPFIRRGFFNTTTKPTAVPNANSIIPAPVATTGPTSLLRVLHCKTDTDIPPNIARLPADVLRDILALLPARVLAFACQVCKEWQLLSSSDSIWWPHISEMGIRLPIGWQGRPAPGAPVSIQPRPPSQPRHLVLGVQSVRALRAGVRVSTDGERIAVGMQVGGTGGGVDAPLRLVVGAAVRQRTSWTTGRYSEHQLQTHSGTVECLAYVNTPLWGPAVISAAWDGAVTVHQMWPAGPAGGLTGASGRRGGPQGWHVGCLPQGVREPRCVRRYHGHTGWISGMAAGKHYVVTSSTDRRVAMWRYQSTSPDPMTMVLHNREVTLVRFAYPGCETTVLTGCADGTVALWDMLKKQLLRDFIGHQDSVWGCARLPGRTHFTSISRDGSMRVWPIPKVLRKAPSSSNRAAGAHMLLPGQPDTHLGAGAHGDRGAGVGDSWEGISEGDAEIAGLLASGKGLDSEVLVCLPRGVWSPAVSVEDTYRFEHVGPTGTSQAPQQQRQEPTQTLHSHTSAVLCMDVYMFSSVAAATRAAHDAQDGISASTAAYGVHDVPKHRCSGCWTPVVDAPLHGCGASTSNSVQARTRCLVATGGADNLVHVWELDEGRNEQGGALQPLHTLQAHSHGVLSLRFGCLPLVEESDRWPAAPGASGPGRPRAQLPGSGRARGRGPVLVTGSVKEVKVWDALSGHCLARLCDHSGPVTCILMSHDHMATLAMGDGVMVYSVMAVLKGRCQPAAQGMPTPSTTSSTPSSAASGTSTHAPVAANGQALTGAVPQMGKVCLHPVFSMMAPAQRMCQAAMAMCPQSLCIGYGTGDVTVLDFTSGSVLRMDME